MIGVMAALSIAAPAEARTVVAVSRATAAQTVVTFSDETPGTLRHGPTAVTGLTANERIVGVDFRPANGRLYAVARDTVTNAARLCTLDPLTGAATAVGPSFGTLVNADADVDFNPVSDRLRIVNTADADLRVTPDTGALAATDGTLAFAAGDANVGDDPVVSAAAYTNSFAGSTATTLYDVDFGNRVLTTQNPPNNGVLNTVGGIGVADAVSVSGMDIAWPGNTAVLSLTSATYPNASFLYEVDLETGDATGVGPIASSAPNRYPFLSVVPPEPVSAPDVAVPEAAGSVTVTLKRPVAISEPAIHYETVAGTATEGADYTATSGTLTIAPGAQTTTIQVPIVNDTADEGTADETFRVRLTSDDEQVDNANGLVTIVDDDGPRPAAEDTPPTVALATAPAADLPVLAPATLTATAADDVGVDRVVFMAGAQMVATDTTAPYTATYTPTEVGPRTLVAIAFDGRGQAAAAIQDRTVVRLAGKLTASTSPKKDAMGARRFTTTGKIDDVPAAACAGAEVTVTFAAGKRTASRRSVKVGADCRFTSSRAKVKLFKRVKTLTVTATLAVTPTLAAAAAAPASVKVR